ncbi:H-NS family nucleoid-associated regulatory protein [Comamonas endophytica]|uniref:H-NS histone family protein n=1 Tax=Comamonas endophytica TaxID=2949090 RepID=A0ABY6GFF5_9BURK|nr:MULTISPECIES: H-NS histone family protein [unclassified Acidovorax]MCD2513240.1 H-NS histone family protein [Acidovorax sp. D4N7]UYG53415.1 H-NS histone family protein [Acidovorax sp. 5MLIR]
MKSLKELLAERAAIEKAIAQEKKVAEAQALKQVHELIAEFGFTAQQVFPWKAPKAHVPGKYLEPKSGATWSGRGKPPAWIAGKDRDQFLIQPASEPEPRQDGPYLAEMAAQAAARSAR